MRSITPGILLASALAVSPAASQPVPFAGTTLQQTVLERWMNGGQRPATTRFESRTENFRVARDERTATGVSLVVRGGLTAADSSLVAVDPRGAVRVQHYLRRPMADRPMIAGTDSTRMARFSLLSGRSRMQLVMPAARLWDVARSAPANARAGTQWADTLRLETEHDGARVLLTGVRRNRVLRDTTVDGRTMLIVRDSASVSYEERFLVEAYMLDTTEQVDRKTTGIIRGLWLLDPQHGHVAWKADTTTLTGTATLTTADGRTVSTPTRFERMRELHALSATELAAHNAGQRPFSIVMVPFTALEKRMQQEGPAIADSLLRVVSATTNPMERDSLLSLLQRWGRVPRARLLQEALLGGDTVRALEYMQYDPQSMSAAWLRAWLPVYDDAARLWRHGLSADQFSEQLASRIRSAPPIASGIASLVTEGPGMPPIREAGACTPDACRLLTGLWPSARDPRLRAVGLLTHAMQDPRVWGDSLVRYVAIAPPVLRPAVAMLNGVGATWPAASKIPLPAPGSDWRRWSEWMTGQAPGTARPTLPGGRALPPYPITRLEESHRAAIAVNVAATGRNIVPELRESFRTATEDSARLVFGTLAVQLRAIPVTGDQLASWFAEPSPMITTLARNALMSFVVDSARPMPDAEAAPLIDTLLAILVNQAPSWGVLHNDTAQLRGFPAELRPGTLRMYADSLPPSVVARWSSKIRPVSMSERGVPDDQLPATTYTISRPLVAGRFVVVRFSLMTQRGPQAYAQGSTYYLMRVGSEYKIVMVSGWIT